MDGTLYYSQDEEEKRNWGKFQDTVKNAINSLGKKEQEEEEENGAVEENDNVDLMARRWCSQADCNKKLKRKLNNRMLTTA